MISHKSKPSSANKKISVAVQKYLDSYAEVESQYLIDLPEQLKFNHVLVIPAFDEKPDFLHRATKIFATLENWLLIIIVNQPDTCPDTTASEALWSAIEESGTQIWQNENLRLIQHNDSNAHLLAVERFRRSNQIPFKQGVGLARKIGCDLAVTLTKKEYLTNEWIHSSDADAHWPQSYFDQTKNLIECSVATYPFRHKYPAGKLGQAMVLYEKSLHYYVDGLRWAKSPYAHYTIGSCQAINSKFYCQARGFPKRSGGEDFYLLNKLAKLAPIAQLTDGPIILEARASIRVPFGTGPALKNILAMNNPNSQLLNYDPRVFLRLKEFLIALNETSSTNFPKSQTSLNTFKDLPKCILSALKDLKFDACLRHIGTNVNSAQQSTHHFHAWFDGFRTLKFIHHLQQTTYPAVPLLQALEQFKELKLSL